MSTIGKEFWVGFMENNRILPSGPNNAGAVDYWIVLITANENLLEKAEKGEIKN